MDKLLEFVKAVFALSMKYSFSVTSWGRTTARNNAVGGVPNSWHLLWMGIDAIPDGPCKKDLEFEKDAAIFNLQAIFEGDHYHLQPK